ncbi:MAG: hypothetical protein IMZ61_04470 [Planctomycetes bacterium]|nr:hypothetical protein [Planctomycetota bacterium]
MKSNSISESSARRVLLIFTSLAAFEGLLALVYLLVVPSDRKGAFLFGFSPARLLVLGVIVAGILVFSFLTYQFGLNPAWRKLVVDGVLRPGRYFFNVVYAVEWCLFALIVILWVFQASPLLEFQPYYARLFSLMVWFMLLAVQSLTAFSWLHYQSGLWGSLKALPPSRLIHIFDNPSVVERLWLQFKYLVGDVRVKYLDTSIPMWILLLLWLGLGVRWFGSRKKDKWIAGLVMLLPTLFLGVNFSFR